MTDGSRTKPRRHEGIAGVLLYGGVLTWIKGVKGIRYCGDSTLLKTFDRTET